MRVNMNQKRHMVQYASSQDLGLLDDLSFIELDSIISFHFTLLVLMIVFKGFVSHLKINKTFDQIFLSLKNTHYLFT
jgi:hypothetical protein